MVDRVSAHGRKRTADESIVNDDDSNNTSNSIASVNNFASTTTTTDTHTAVQESDGVKYQDVLEAWEEVGDLSKEISRTVLSCVVGRLRKFRRLSKNDRNANNFDDNKKAGFFDMIQRAKRLERSVLLFCCKHEMMQRDLKGLLEKIRSTENDDDEAAVSAEVMASTETVVSSETL